MLGSAGGHGLGDLVYLFGGALLGGLVGAALGIFGAVRWGPRQRWHALGVALAAAAVSVTAALVADRHGLW